MRGGRSGVQQARNHPHTHPKLHPHPHSHPHPHPHPTAGQVATTTPLGHINCLAKCNENHKKFETQEKNAQLIAETKWKYSKGHRFT